ncbi:MAG: hypothetical protein AB7P21_18205 [Lautropia sp.]
MHTTATNLDEAGDPAQVVATDTKPSTADAKTARRARRAGRAEKRDAPKAKRRDKIVKASIAMTRSDAERLDALKLRAQILVAKARKRDVIAAALELLSKSTDARLVSLLGQVRPDRG